MSDTRTLAIRTPAQRDRAVELVRRIPVDSDRPRYDVTIAPHRERITAEQRALLFALCGDLSRQLPFPGGGRANATSWKHFLVALYRGEKLVREGSVVVVVNGSIADETKREASELIEFIQAWGAERGVRFSAPKRHEGAHEAV